MRGAERLYQRVRKSVQDRWRSLTAAGGRGGEPVTDDPDTTTDPDAPTASEDDTEPSAEAFPLIVRGAGAAVNDAAATELAHAGHDPDAVGDPHAAAKRGVHRDRIASEAAQLADEAALDGKEVIVIAHPDPEPDANYSLAVVAVEWNPDRMAYTYVEADSAPGTTGAADGGEAR